MNISDIFDSSVNNKHSNEDAKMDANSNKRSAIDS
jgi:hypothetical protein